MSDPKQALLGGLAAFELGANILFPNRTLEEQFAHFQQEAHQSRLQQASELQQAVNRESLTPAQVSTRPSK